MRPCVVVGQPVCSIFHDAAHRLAFLRLGEIPSGSFALRTENGIRMITPALQQETEPRDSSTMPILEVNPIAIARSVIVARFAGTTYRVNRILLVLVGLFSALAVVQRDMSHAIMALLVLLTLILHEAGHLIAARLLGYRVPTVILSLFENNEALAGLGRSWHGTLIGVAGPLVNLCSAGVLYLSFASHNHTALFNFNASDTPGLMEGFVSLNLLIGLVNLIPAVPFDGGNIIRVWLAAKMGPLSGAEMTLLFSRFQIPLFVLIGIISHNLFSAIIALLVLISSNQAASSSKYQTALRRLTARDALISDFQTLSSGDTLHHIQPLVHKTEQAEFPVVSGKDIVGVLMRGMYDHYIALGKGNLYVAEIMSRHIPRIAPTDSLEVAVRRSWNGRHCLPVLVFEEEQFLGIVTPDSIREAMNRSLIPAA